MGDKLKHKYKGKICSPAKPNLNEKKSTKIWCKGKNGLEHKLVTVYNSRPDQNWGLATNQWQICSQCNKVVGSKWSSKNPRHSFGSILKAIRLSKGIETFQIAEAIGVPDSLITEYESDNARPSIQGMQKIVDFLNVEMRIEFLGSKGSHWYGHNIQLETRIDA